MSCFFSHKFKVAGIGMEPGYPSKKFAMTYCTKCGVVRSHVFENREDKGTKDGNKETN